MRTVFELSKEPPQKGRELHLMTRATCHGNSFFSAGSPPTILLLLPVETPHLHDELADEAGLVVTEAGGEGLGLGGQTTILQQ